VRIALPEGASNIKYNTAIDIDSEDSDVLVSYLDTAGRPVLVLHATNLVEEETELLEVTYDFSQSTLIREPMMVVVFFFVIFLIVIIFNRIDFSIDTSSKEYQHEVARKKAEYYIDSIDSLFGRNSNVFVSFFQAVQNGKPSEVNSAFENVKQAKTSMEKFRSYKDKIDKLEAGIGTYIHEIVSIEQKRFKDVEKAKAAFDSNNATKEVEALQKQVLEKESASIEALLLKLQ
jgi:oligosaccharyltransferase complex subunit alpha (ribophorin I)